MKNPYFVLWLSFVLCMVIVSSCVQVSEIPATPSPAIVVQRTSTSTHIPIYKPPPTVSRTPTSLPDMDSPLPVEEAEAQLLKLLANNGGCQLPCLWGIIPGKSSYFEARTILAPLRKLSNTFYLDPPGPGSLSPRYTVGDLEIYTRIAFLTNPDTGTVDHVGFTTEAHNPLDEGGYEDVFDSDFFGENTPAYALPNVLTEQGIPSSIMISTVSGSLTRDGTGGFDILLLYPDRGILVNYTTQMYLIGEIVRGCPKNSHIKMELYPAGQVDSFFTLIRQTDLFVLFDYSRPLEEVTAMSMDEFYETFREPTDKCIETLASLWPTPEP